MGIPNEIEDDLSKWQKCIEDFSQGNALLKYKLSEIVDSYEDKKFLLVAEYFQNELLLTDEILKRLRSEVLEYSEMKQQGLIPIEKLNKKRSTLKNDLLNFEKKFLRFSDDFNKKMKEEPRY